MADSILMEKNGMRLDVPIGLVLSYTKSGWWRVPQPERAPESVPEPKAESEPEAEPNVESSAAPAIPQKTRAVGKRRQK